MSKSSAVMESIKNRARWYVNTEKGEGSNITGVSLSDAVINDS